MELFSRRARDERLRKETAAVTRQELVWALANLVPFINKRVGEWYRSLTAGVWEAIGRWFATRVENQQRILLERFEKQKLQASERLSAAAVQKLAEAHRQTVIKKIGAGAKKLFTDSMQRRAAELLLSVTEEVEKTKGAVHSGDEALPNGTRFFFRNARGARVYVIEQPPVVRTVRFQLRDETRYRSYRLAFPFVVFIVHFIANGDFCCLYAFFRNERLKSIDDTLYAAALSNINKDSDGVCFPGLRTEELRLSVSEKTERVLDSFWGSGFNADWSQNFVKSQEQNDEIRSLQSWQSNTDKNPQFVLGLDWLPSRRGQLRETMRSIWERHEEAPESADGNPLRHVSTPLMRVAERVGQDVMMSALELIPSWKIEKAPSEVLTSELQKLFSEGARGLEDMVAESAREIFAEIPNLEQVAAQGEQLRVTFAREVDQKIEWIGLTQPVPVDVSKDLRTRSNP